LFATDTVGFAAAAGALVLVLVVVPLVPVFDDPPPQAAAARATPAKRTVMREDIITSCYVRETSEDWMVRPPAG